MNSLILLRHGQSQWNLENRFTGWKDVPLTKKGIEEAIKAGLLIKENKIKIDIIFSSILQRANKTAELALIKKDFVHLWNNNQLIMKKSQNLNERDYGDLVGLNKEETAEKFGKDQVHIWRRSYDVSPPGGESLKNVVDAAELKLRGGSILTDYGTVVQGTKAAAETGLKTWDSVVTVAKSGNAMGEIMLGGHALGESIAEWRKSHYFCCACSGVACSCFWVAAAASFIPGGYGVWQAATQAGSVTKGVTYTCRRVTGGF